MLLRAVFQAGQTFVPTDLMMHEGSTVAPELLTVRSSPSASVPAFPS